jgi:endonuclease/exonuclease/phosphatase family metal-dependent hydrolase
LKCSNTCAWILLTIIIIIGCFMVFFIGNKLKNESYKKKLFMATHLETASRGSAKREEVNQTTSQHTAIPKEDKEVLLMTFNIRHGVDGDGNESLNSIIEEIKNSDAQIIALQEVDRYMPRSGFKDQAKEIAMALGFDYVYGETINVLGVKYGNAIISAYPILEHENLKLPSNSLEGRGLLKAKVDINGHICNILTTHLGLNNDERYKQVQAVNKIIEDIDPPIIMMGDFNGEPHNREMKSISGKVMDTAVTKEKDDLYTYAFYCDVPNTRIDRIYASEEIDVKDHYVAPSKSSDHLMVYALVLFNEGKKEGIVQIPANSIE